MAKKKIATTNQAREELKNINEAKRHLQGMMRYWQLRADDAYTDKEILKQQTIIRKAEKRIKVLVDEKERAPEKIKAIRSSHRQLEKRKAGYTNRHLVSRLKKLAAQIKELE